MKQLGEYHDLYVQSDTLLLADAFNKFWNMCHEIYALGPVLFCFFSAPGLAWQAAIKMTGIKLDPLTDIDMLLMLEKVKRGGICQNS